MVIFLERGADGLHMFHLMPLHPETPLSFASLEPRIVSYFWYRLIQVVLENSPLLRLNGCFFVLNSKTNLYNSRIVVALDDVCRFKRCVCIFYCSLYATSFTPILYL